MHANHSKRYVPSYRYIRTPLLPCPALDSCLTIHIQACTFAEADQSKCDRCLDLISLMVNRKLRPCQSCSDSKVKCERPSSDRTNIDQVSVTRLLAFLHHSCTNIPSCSLLPALCFLLPATCRIPAYAARSANNPAFHKHDKSKM